MLHILPKLNQYMRREIHARPCVTKLLKAINFELILETTGPLVLYYGHCYGILKTKTNYLNMQVSMVNR